MLLTSCFRNTAAAVLSWRSCVFLQEESVDVKALRARFNSKASASDTSSRDSSSPKSPRPRFGKAILPGTDNNLAHRRLSPPLPPALSSPGLVRLPRAESMATSIPIRPPSFPRPPLNSRVRPSIQPLDASKVKQKAEMPPNIMLRHQRPPKPAPAPGLAPAPAPAPTSTPLPLRQQSRQRSGGEVTPLRRPLPPEGPLPLKPKRPPSVNLEPYMRFSRGQALPAPRKSDSESLWLIKFSQIFLFSFFNHCIYYSTCN